MQTSVLQGNVRPISLQHKEPLLAVTANSAKSLNWLMFRCKHCRPARRRGADPVNQSFIHVCCERFRSFGVEVKRAATAKAREQS
jgi:hypothetical protein